ncbi:hypothetical protein K0U83_21780 [bacterium]|nr:hypothetical protein [bacterium]
MSLTPGFIHSDVDQAIGITLPELAAIVAEWDRACEWPRDVRASEKTIIVKGMAPVLRVRWYGYGTKPLLTLERGQMETVYVGGADIAEMRAVLAAQGAA